VAIGQRIGMIRFGSQVDLVLPSREDVRVTVRPGEHVRAGESTIALLSRAPGEGSSAEAAGALPVGAGTEREFGAAPQTDGIDA